MPRMHDVMRHLLHQLIVVATGVFLALPPGACGAFCQQQAGSAPVKAHCCHSTAAHHPADSKNAPSQPSVKCCCVHDATLPGKSFEPTSPFDLAYLQVADHCILNAGIQSGGETSFAPLRSGPSLQILLCVWRC